MEGLTDASSDGICFPLFTRKVCSHALLCAEFEKEMVSEQAVAVMPTSERSKSASLGEFPEVKQDMRWKEH